MEIWKDIDEYYEVSNKGNVRSKPRIIFRPYKDGFRKQTIKGKILTQQPSLDGYLRVKLHNKYVRVSYLVANAFIDNPNNWTVIHHKDHNNQNNCSDNLEWMDVVCHNSVHSVEKRKKVYQYTLNGEFVREWESTNECGKNGYSQSKVCLCCNGKRIQHKGYKWSYLSPNY